MLHTFGRHSIQCTPDTPQDELAVLAEILKNVSGSDIEIGAGMCMLVIRSRRGQVAAQCKLT